MHTQGAALQLVNARCRIANGRIIRHASPRLSNIGACAARCPGSLSR
jgi:hypothetical protein